MKNVGLWAALFAAIGYFVPILYSIAAPFILLYAVYVLTISAGRLFVWLFHD